MKPKHIAFCLEQAYGHIIPTLGIAIELIRRGHRVSYAVNQSFARMIERIEARPAIIDPPDNRERMLAVVISDTDCLEYKSDQATITRISSEVMHERTARTVEQLKAVYASDRPDVIIHDDCFDTAGRDLATAWQIPHLRHHSQFIDDSSSVYSLQEFARDRLIMMTVPEFFQPTPLDARFRFVGFIPEGRDRVFEPWRTKRPVERTIVISATTGLMPQIEFCRIMVDTFRDQPFEIILSVSGALDVVSAFDPAELGRLPRNILLNRTAGNFEVLQSASMFIGQGGQGAALEAIYWGLPQIVIPPTAYHLSVGNRVQELHLGQCLTPNQLSPENLIRHVRHLLEDETTLRSAASAGERLRGNSGASMAAGIIEEYC